MALAIIDYAHGVKDGTTEVVVKGFYGIVQAILPISVEAFEKGIFDYRNGKLIQDAFPTLPKEHREFLMTGLDDKQWNELFSPCGECPACLADKSDNCEG